MSTSHRERERESECIWASHVPGLKSTISRRRLYSLSSMLTTFRGSTSFFKVTEATADTPELMLVGLIAFPVLPSNRTPGAVWQCVCVHRSGGGGE